MELGDILAGPIIRRLTANQLVLWWVSPFACQGQFHCYDNVGVDEGGQSQIQNIELNGDNLSVFKVGARAYVHLLDLAIELPIEQVIEYDLLIDVAGQLKPLAETLPNLTYPGKLRPSLVVQPNITNLLHGSCRNPHHASEDSLLIGEQRVASSLDSVAQRPALLMLSGDQIYADHVAAPTLHAIHQVIELLGLNDEQFDDHQLGDSQQLYQQNELYYQREQILPRITTANKWFRPGGTSPIFTSTYAHNHLITFSEAIAMYILVWSPSLWPLVTLECAGIKPQDQQCYQQELANVSAFVQGLPKVQRLLAHIPTYMIFDDHDVTDDWNLTAQWEQAAYQDGFSRRIIGNMLMAYWLCQGWGNDPKQFDGDFSLIANAYRDNPSKDNHDSFIEYLYKFAGWQYSLDTTPKLVVLDSRTRRWRSEHDLADPSGLMDWEALCDLQQELIGHPSIILVSPAPMFGVKVIEAIQRVATVLGQPLAVDAENWMAHPGSASTVLNIFKHPKTPHHFVILSGDVHYSFVYDIEIRFRHFSPKIWQITSSGIKNQFPQPAIGILDRLNRWLYSANSPLNIFTKRRHMKVKGRKVVGKKHQRLVEKSGLGYLELHHDGSPKHICDLHNDGSVSEFVSR